MNLVAWIPFFPLAGFLLLGIGRRAWPRHWVGPLASGLVFLSFLFALVVFSDLLGLPPESRSVKTVLFQWLTVGRFSAEAALLVDPLSIVMTLVVTGVGFLIHVYSIGYMKDDPDYVRYFTYLNLFMFMMLTLVLGANYLLLYVGWEGVGLCSYLLIGFWYTREAAAEAGKKAFLVNRVGDFGFALGLFLLFWTLGSLDFGDVARKAPLILAAGGGTATLICLLLFLGATGKSAQIPLYVWLPDAMEGPTPVSALIHAATMVTAGVYMVARSASLFVLSPQALGVVAATGAATALFAATMAVAQTDIKKVLAYSTISQLGYMFVACGVGAFSAGVFHLVTHAFFKALLFLGAGSVIMGMHHEQDMTRMGGLSRPMPHTHRTMLIATLAICGIIPLSGFVSKDAILWAAFDGPYASRLIWLVCLLVAVLTAFYMFRLYYLTFRGTARWSGDLKPHESSSVMVIPLQILAFLSIVAGVLGWPRALGGSDRFGQFLEPMWPRLAEGHAAMSVEWFLMALTLLLVTLGILAARRLYLSRPEQSTTLASRFRGVQRLLAHAYYVDQIYHALFVAPVVMLGRFFWQVGDVWIINGLAHGAGALARGFGQLGGRVQSGLIRTYILVFAFGVVLLLGYYALAWTR